MSQIEPVWLGVDLEMAAKLAGGSGDALHVDVKGLALTNQPPRRMTENGDVTVQHGADDAIRLALARQVEMRVHGRDHDVQLGQACIRQIERSPSLRMSTSIPLRMVMPRSRSFSRSICLIWRDSRAGSRPCAMATRRL